MSNSKSVIIPNKLGVNQNFIATGLVLGGPFVISGANHLSVVVEGVGGGNIVLVKARIAGQTAYNTIATITGLSTGTDVDVSLYDQVEFDCTTFSASGTPNLVVSSFFKSAPAGFVSSINTLTGAVTLAAGTGITLTPSGQTITIAAPQVGTVTSVGLAGPVGYTVSGSPVTSSGTLTLTQNASQAISASAIDWSAGNIFTKTLAANTTFTFSNSVDGQTIIVRLTNTASNYTVTWPSVKWSGGSAPVMTTGATSDVYTFFKDGSNIYGSAVQDLH